MKIYDCEQRSDLWRALRLGKITGSNADRLLTDPKRKTYAQELLVELLTESEEDRFVSDAMQWGIDQEPNAILWYELETGSSVKPVGFVISGDNDNFGASPDGLVGEDGLIEVKCPGSRAHLDHLEHGPGSKYLQQMQWQMYVTDRQWCDFVSYSPRFDEDLQGCIFRIQRDPPQIGKLIAGADKVLSHMERFKRKVIKSF